MAFEFVGVEMEDDGPKGIVARFMKASIDGDQETGLALLTADSRDGMKLHGPPIDSGRVVFGDVTMEEGLAVVPTTTEGDGASESIDFVLKKEEDAFRIDMDATMSRAMGGVSPQDLVEGMAEAMGGAMGQLGDAISGAMEGLAGPSSEAVERMEPIEKGERTEGPDEEADDSGVGTRT